MNIKQFRRNCLAGALLACAVSPVSVNAQGYLSDATSSSAVLTRDPARQASTEIDAVVTNPAGTAFLQDGLHLSASGIFAFRNINMNEAETPSSVMETKETKIVPAVQLAYKKGRWAVSASFASEGGFGNRKSDGSLLLNGLLNSGGMQELLNEMNSNLNIYWLLCKIGNFPELNISEEDQYAFGSKGVRTSLQNWTTRIGGSFKLTDNFSAYIGLKANYVYSQQKATPKLEIIRPSTHERWGMTDYFQKAFTVIENSDVDPEKKELFENLFADLVENATQMEGELNNIKYDFSVHGWGLAPVIGLDYQYKDFNFGAKYEFASRVNASGTKDFKIPANLSVGMSWQALKKWKFAAGSNVIFSTDGSVNAANKVSSAYDISASATYDITDQWLVSLGGTYGYEQLITPEFFFLPDVSLHNYRVSFGTAFSLSDNLQINLGANYSLINYDCNMNSSYIWASKVVDVKSRCEFKPKFQLAVGVNYHI